MEWRFCVLTSVLSLFFTSIATAVMLYITLAVSVGPWIDVTLALLACALVHSMLRQYVHTSAVSMGIIATAAGSIGGIVANALSWSVPTLYFLDPVVWNALHMQGPYFAVLLAGLIVAAGGTGLLIAERNADALLADSSISFPIAQLVYKTVAVQESISAVLRLLSGVTAVSLFHAIQVYTTWVPRVVLCMQRYSVLCWDIPRVMISMDTAPMLWAIGFIAGHVIAIPYGVGVLLRIFLLEPCHRFWFSSCAFEETFLLAFCTGLIVYGVISSFGSLWGIPVYCRQYLAKLQEYAHSASSLTRITHLLRIDYVAVCTLVAVALLYYSQLSLVGAIYVVVAASMCAYQLILLMGRVGLAPLGRFATFVMVPGLLLFRYSALQATIVAAFVEIAGGVAASAASGYKAVGLADRENRNAVYPFLWLGLCVSALVAGSLFVILVNYFGLGDASILVAQRARSRALLIQAHEMHVGIMVLGMFGGWVLHKLRCNSTLVLGGILMPFQYSLMLIAGGISSYLFSDKEWYYPFWSGVFSASALWMIVRAFLA